MTRFRAFVISGALLFGFAFNFAGCFEWEEPCTESAAAAGVDGPICV